MRLGAAHHGQASPEYVGLVALLALAATALAAIDLGSGIASSIQGALCRAVGAECSLGSAAAASGPSVPLTDPALTEQELLDMALEASLDDFQAIRDSANHDPRMDYSDDGCSAPVVGSSGPWFHFREACERHDFGYRNSKRLGLFDTYKKRIDAIFAEDMYDACLVEAWWQRRACRYTAGAFYSGVVLAGGHCYVPGTRRRVPGPCAPEHG